MTSDPSGSGPIRIATRASELALWQAREVRRLIVRADPTAVVEIVELSTEGDRRTDVPIAVIGGKGVFVKEVQAALLDGRADIAVHSAKDLPAVTPDGLVIAAVPERGDPRDALVGAALDELGPESVVATGSARRRVQLQSALPGTTFVGLRGNIGTRLTKAENFDAIVMAHAALVRLDLQRSDVQVLSVDEMIPQVGQGTLAVECRNGNSGLRDLLSMIDHAPSRRTLEAERAFLQALGGDCDLPAGAHAMRTNGNGNGNGADQPLRITGVLASLDGVHLVRGERSGVGPEIGQLLADELVAQLADL